MQELKLNTKGSEGPIMQYAVNPDGSPEENFQWALDGRKARA